MQHSSSSNHHQQPPQESSPSSPTTSSQFSYPYHSQQQQQQQQPYQQQTQPQSQSQRHIIKQTTISQQQPQQPLDMMYQPQSQHPQQQQQQSISSSSSSSSSSYQRMAPQHHQHHHSPPPPLQHHNYQHYPSTNAPQAKMESSSSSQQQQQQPPPPPQQMIHAPATHASPPNVNSPSVMTTIPKKGPSCHHCRQSHIGCDGNRPCQNCVRKNKICFDYDKKLIRKSVGGGGGGGASSSTPGATKSKVPPSSTSTPPPPTTSSSAITPTPTPTPTPTTTVNERVYHNNNSNSNSNHNNSNIGSFHYVENTMDNNNQAHNSSSNHQFHAIQMMEHEMESIREQLNKRDEQMKGLAVQNQFLMKVVNELKELDNHHHPSQQQKQSPSLLGSSSSSSTSISNVNKTSSSNNNDNFYMFQTPQQHEYSLMVWEPPQELLRPCYMFDTVTFRIIGCNRAFCEMTGYSVEELKRTSLFSMLPERLREPWKVLLQWAAYSSIQTLDGTGIVLFSGNRETCVKVRRVIEKNFMRVEYEPTTIFTDSFVVDGIQIPETFRIMYNEVLHQNMLAIPTTSYQRLLDLFVKLKSLRETHYTSLPESLGNVHRPSPSASPQQPQSQQQYSQSQQSQQPQTQQQVQQTGRSSSDSNGEQGYSNTSCNSMSNNANSSSAHGASGSSLGYQATVHPPEYEFQQLADKYGAKIYSQMIADQQQQSNTQAIQPRYSATQPVTYTYTHTPSGTVISLPHSMETFSISMANDQSVPIVRPALPSHVFLGKPT